MKPAPTVIYIVFNRTDKTVEAAFYEYEDAVKDLEDWRRIEPNCKFIILAIGIQ